MYRGPTHTRPILKISGLLFVASAGAYSWGRQGTQEPQPKKNNNTSKMAVITPFQVSQTPTQVSLEHMSFPSYSAWQNPFAVSYPFGCLPFSLGTTQEKTTEHGLMKPELDPLRRVHDL